jgi:bifunctional non-homologous end joining protein LigD
VGDDEIVVPATDGTTDFPVLQNELKSKSTSIVLVAFDLLSMNGRDFRKLPLFQRKAELKRILSGTDIQYNESSDIDGCELFAHACKLGLEGVVWKVPDSVYATGRTNDWVKKPCAAGDADRCRFRARRCEMGRVLRRPAQGDDLVYAGKVDHGFEVSAAGLRKR